MKRIGNIYEQITSLANLQAHREIIPDKEMQIRFNACLHLFLVIAECTVPSLIIVANKKIPVAQSPRLTIPRIQLLVQRIIDRQELVAVEFFRFTMPHLYHKSVEAGERLFPIDHYSLKSGP